MDCVGTRYHPKDLYATFQKQSYKVYDDDTGEELREEMVWDIFMRVVEEGGTFWWPRERGPNGKSYGFNPTVLSQIKAEYEDKVQFYSQYYNNPNDPDTVRIGKEKFQYYDRKFLKMIDGRWSIHGKPLNVFAGLDFAFSLARKADSTCLVVVGIDSDHQYYVLDIERFKSDRIKDYFDAIFRTHNKWGYKKLRAEVTTAQQVIVRDLKENYIVPQGLGLMVDEYRPTRHDGNKEERVSATLEPKYDNMQVWHYKGGEIADLEDELVMAKPPHDDIKDALTAAIDIAVAPRPMRLKDTQRPNVIYHSRFGGTR
jgi:hypothetical protein